MVTQPSSSFRRRRWRLSPLVAALASLLACEASAAQAPAYAEAQFDPMMLWGAASRADVERFTRRNVLEAGRHYVEVVVNERRGISMPVQFVSAADDAPLTDAHACFTQAQWQRLGVKLAVLAPALRERMAAGQCLGVKALYPGSLEQYDFSASQLLITVPQAFIQYSAYQDVSPDQWQSGITAFRNNYSYSYQRFSSRGVQFSSFNALLDSGLNVGGWFLRNSAYFSQSQGLRQFRSQRTTLQTDIPSWRARLVMGQLYTGAEYFSAYRMQGVMLSTDPAMLPYSERLYRPTVRGVANSQATVQILQGQSVIYQGRVAPGPFAIDDYSPIGYGGDLTLVITEANGAEQRYTVPFGNAVRLIRKGQLQYSLSAGRYEPGPRGGLKPWMAQATARWGVQEYANLYGGVLAAGSQYGAVSIGAGFNTPVGAVSLDSNWARARRRGEPASWGVSYRLSYTKTVSATRTVVRLATVRYSSEGFWTLNDALSGRFSDVRPGRPRGEFNLSMSQPLGRWGSVYLSGSLRNYWHAAPRQTQWQVGYSTRVQGVTVSVTASASRGGFGSGRQVMLNLSIPLSGWKAGGVLRSTVLQDSGRGHTERISYDNTVGRNRALSYGLDITRDAQRQQGYGLNASYVGRYGYVSAAASRQGETTQWSVNGNGGLVIHSGGVTLGQTLPDSIGLIEARDAGGATIANMGNAKLDGNGYGLVSLSPYSVNEVQISPENLSLDVELQSTTEEAIPRAGAVVPLVFKTKRERAALLVIGPEDRARLPFGTPIHDQDGTVIGTIGQGGRALLRGVTDQGALVLRFTDGESCRVPYRLQGDGAQGEGRVPLIPLRCGGSP
ncbi:fimbria/pilus outer membrane usher protein [Bordetella trematum]|uniref:fimbria/pilus outer membrane usher protein n=1 Tax=Bordetella trematum TaxID=123899 RepID=UPI0015584989|nr:fimbria/pilus outer membrane usher protein [Bordetella trematum]